MLYDPNVARIGPAPCEKGCSNYIRCGVEKLACRDFHLYVMTGESSAYTIVDRAATRKRYLKVMQA
jgi:hypothetical protein